MVVRPEKFFIICAEMHTIEHRLRNKSKITYFKALKPSSAKYR